MRVHRWYLGVATKHASEYMSQNSIGKKMFVKNQRNHEITKSEGIWFLFVELRCILDSINCTKQMIENGHLHFKLFLITEKWFKFEPNLLMLKTLTKTKKFNSKWKGYYETMTKYSTLLWFADETFDFYAFKFASHSVLQKKRSKFPSIIIHSYKIKRPNNRFLRNCETNKKSSTSIVLRCKIQKRAKIANIFSFSVVGNIRVIHKIIKSEHNDKSMSVGDNDNSMIYDWKIINFSKSMAKKVAHTFKV